MQVKTNSNPFLYFRIPQNLCYKHCEYKKSIYSHCLSPQLFWIITLFVITLIFRHNALHIFHLQFSSTLSLKVNVALDKCCIIYKKITNNSNNNNNNNIHKSTSSLPLPPTPILLSFLSFFISSL